MPVPSQPASRPSPPSPACNPQCTPPDRVTLPTLSYSLDDPCTRYHNKRCHACKIGRCELINIQEFCECNIEASVHEADYVQDMQLAIALMARLQIMYIASSARPRCQMDMGVVDCVMLDSNISADNVMPDIAVLVDWCSFDWTMGPHIFCLFGGRSDVSSSLEAITSPHNPMQGVYGRVYKVRWKYIKPEAEVAVKVMHEYRFLQARALQSFT
ncbi:hypothetical protein CALCODRAFT_484839 [Calocera cornea HHB12733]|uniref:Uncharacterized protein n=1 Tax=Calocera cornea HHB12733 TaxID=1353952 RepID=A0A165ERF8_9BASI|nr:hypothetical protein CALCODRAFT_484839 [Calocera cornea HHB12733]